MDDTGPTGHVDATGGTGSTGDATGGTGAEYLAQFHSEPPVDFLSLDDILGDHTLLLTKQAADKSLLDQIGSQHVLGLKPKLVEWVGLGKPYSFPVMLLDIQPPSKCCDGECRNLPDYITFCSGRSISEHVAMLQAKLSGINVSFANLRGQVAIVVSPMP